MWHSMIHEGNICRFSLDLLLPRSFDKSHYLLIDDSLLHEFFEESGKIPHLFFHKKFATCCNWTDSGFRDASSCCIWSTQKERYTSGFKPSKLQPDIPTPRGKWSQISLWWAWDHFNRIFSTCSRWILVPLLRFTLTNVAAHLTTHSFRYLWLCEQVGCIILIYSWSK